MKLEDQVVSLELAKKLKELGVPQNSYFVHAKLGERPERWNIQPKDTQYDDECAAFTVAELGEMLPQYLIHDGFSFELTIIRSSVWRFYYGYPPAPNGIFLTTTANDTEADARAKMLIYLLENKLISVENTNPSPEE